jgi:hypothetical protein
MSLRATQPARSEREIQRAILDYLAVCPGVVAWRANTGAVAAEHRGRRRFVRFGIAGQADIIGWVRWCGRLKAARYPIPVATDCASCCARFLAIEVKRPGQSPSATQATFLELVRQAGGLAVVATCVDDVRQALGR